jgi:hypothetical protein
MSQTFLCPIIALDPPVVETCPECGWEFHASADWIGALTRNHPCEPLIVPLDTGDTE